MLDVLSEQIPVASVVFDKSSQSLTEYGVAVESTTVTALPMEKRSDDPVVSTVDPLLVSWISAKYRLSLPSWHPALNVSTVSGSNPISVAWSALPDDPVRVTAEPLAASLGLVEVGGLHGGSRQVLDAAVDVVEVATAAVEDFWITGRRRNPPIPPTTSTTTMPKIHQGARLRDSADVEFGSLDPCECRARSVLAWSED
jgi:hypothetical protein